MTATSNGAVVLGILSGGILAGLLAALALSEIVPVRPRRLVIGCVLIATAIAAVLYWSVLGYGAVA